MQFAHAVKWEERQNILSVELLPSLNKTKK